jgi:LL-diaminopimelate aminotransferase
MECFILAKINEKLPKFKDSYLFSDICKRVAKLFPGESQQANHPSRIGDVTLPLMPAVVAGLHNAVDDMSKAESSMATVPSRDTFSSQCNPWVLSDVGVELEEDEIFVSDGAKSDLGTLPICSRWITPS